VIEYREKQYRALQKPGWESDLTLFEKLAKGTMQLTEGYIAEGSVRHLSSARMKLRGLLKKTEDTFGNLPIYKELEQLLQRVEELEKSKQ
jgi:hypothetical protein